MLVQLLTRSQGASSTDFYRFIHTFYKPRSTPLVDPQVASQPTQGEAQGRLGSAFYEKVWQWVTNHADIRIRHDGQDLQCSLADFERAEHPDSVPQSANTIISQTTAASLGKVQPAQPILACVTALRARLSGEQAAKERPEAVLQHVPELPPAAQDGDARQPLLGQQSFKQRRPRSTPTNLEIEVPLFDEPTSKTAAPRLYASQNRIWQALTGHSMDLKKVPTMEFALLSLIAAAGVDGITQPELTHTSGQDKRSVPHRTDELGRKGYIVKTFIQAGKMRTSLCVLKKFATDNSLVSSAAVEDVFQEGRFVASGFAHLLYNKLKDAGVVPTRDIRPRLVSTSGSLLDHVLIHDRACPFVHGTSVPYRAVSFASTRLV